MALGGSEKLNKDAQFVRDTDGRMVVVGINGAAIGGGGGGTTGTPADSFANPGAIPEELSFPMVFDGSVWHRMRGGNLFAAASNSVLATTLGLNAAAGATTERAADNLTDAIAGSYFPGALPMLFNGANFDRGRTPAVFKDLPSTAVTAGTGITVWTPAAGKKFRLMGFCLSASVAASIIFGDNAVGTILFRTPALAAAGVIVVGADMLGNGKLSAAANNVLKLDVTATGNVAGFIFGTEE
jgi:hypothetical protein